MHYRISLNLQMNKEIVYTTVGGLPELDDDYTVFWRSN